MFHLTQASLALTRLTVCIRARKELAQKKKKKDRFSSIFLRISFPPEYSLSLSLLPSFTRLFPSPSLICFSSSLLFFPFVQSLSASSSLFLLLILLSFSIPPSCFFHSLTSKCFVRANFNENRVITREVQGTKGKTDARSKKKRVGDPR